LVPLRGVRFSRSILRPLAVLTMAFVLASIPARAQTTNTLASAAAEENAWSFSVAAATYVLSDDRHYVQPTVTANRGWLHLEARGNYEGLNTGSAWIGVNFSGGKTLEWELTPMLGGVFGDTTGIAPGLKASFSWRKLELYGENEYVVDANNGEDSFFYNWSELTLAPADWFRFGVVTQRTRVYQSDREIQRGVMAGVSFKRVNVTGYVFNPDKDTRFVLAVELTF
jgi:hypothetical protein